MKDEEQVRRDAIVPLMSDRAQAEPRLERPNGGLDFGQYPQCLQQRFGIPVGGDLIVYGPNCENDFAVCQSTARPAFKFGMGSPCGETRNGENAETTRKPRQQGKGNSIQLIVDAVHECPSSQCSRRCDLTGNSGPVRATIVAKHARIRCTLPLLHCKLLVLIL